MNIYKILLNFLITVLICGIIIYSDPQAFKIMQLYTKFAIAFCVGFSSYNLLDKVFDCIEYLNHRINKLLCRSHSKK